jgi:hypothetical protein
MFLYPVTGNTFRRLANYPKLHSIRNRQKEKPTNCADLCSGATARSPFSLAIQWRRRGEMPADCSALI